MRCIQAACRRNCAPLHVLKESAAALGHRLRMHAVQLVGNHTSPRKCRLGAPACFDNTACALDPHPAPSLLVWPP